MESLHNRFPPETRSAIDVRAGRTLEFSKRRSSSATKSQLRAPRRVRNLDHPSPAGQR